MTATTGAKPFFRAEQVGSLLRRRGCTPRARWKAREITRDALRAVEEDAIAEAVRLQEEIGLRVIVDGEFRRENWWIDFVERGQRSRPAPLHDPQHLPAAGPDRRSLGADLPLPLFGRGRAQAARRAGMTPMPGRQIKNRAARGGPVLGRLCGPGQWTEMRPRGLLFSQTVYWLPPSS